MFQNVNKGIFFLHFLVFLNPPASFHKSRHSMDTGSGGRMTEQKPRKRLWNYRSFMLCGEREAPAKIID
jgi:hypothetical protein